MYHQNTGLIGKIHRIRWVRQGQRDRVQVKRRVGRGSAVVFTNKNGYDKSRLSQTSPESICDSFHVHGQIEAAPFQIKDKLQILRNDQVFNVHMIHHIIIQNEKTSKKCMMTTRFTRIKQQSLHQNYPERMVSYQRIIQATEKSMIKSTEEAPRRITFNVASSMPIIQSYISLEVD